LGLTITFQPNRNVRTPQGCSLLGDNLNGSDGFRALFPQAAKPEHLRVLIMERSRMVNPEKE